MKFAVNSEACHGHQVCTAMLPDLFSCDDLGYAVVLNDGQVPAGEEDSVRQVAANCPEQAITVDESDA
jgi:ferredoxin